MMADSFRLSWSQESRVQPPSSANGGPDRLIVSLRKPKPVLSSPCQRTVSTPALTISDLLRPKSNRWPLETATFVIANLAVNLTQGITRRRTILDKNATTHGTVSTTIQPLLLSYCLHSCNTTQPKSPSWYFHWSDVLNFHQLCCGRISNRFWVWGDQLSSYCLLECRWMNAQDGRATKIQFWHFIAVNKGNKHSPRVAKGPRKVLK